MILKQFLETNRTNIRTGILQQRNLKKKTPNLIKRKKVNDSDQLHLSLKIQTSKLLQKKSRQVALMKRNFSKRQTTKKPDSNQNGQFFISKEEKNLERKISLCLKPITKDTALHETIDSESEKDHRRTFLENLLFQNKNSSLFLKSSKNMLMAVKRCNSDFAKVPAGVINLSQSLMLKTDLSSPQRLNSAKIPQTHSVQSIHSRGGLRNQQQRFRKRKVLSQHSFRQTMEASFDLKGEGNQTLQNNWFKQKQLKEMDQLQIGIERIDLKQKPKKKDEYVNMFCEHRTLKAKVNKDEIYTPWRKQMMNKQGFDLSELLQIHH